MRYTLQGEKAARRRLSIGIVSLSAVPDDPRVRRQGDLFHSQGWEVVAVGLPGARSRPPPWRSLEISIESPGSMVTAADGFDALTALLEADKPAGAASLPNSTALRRSAATYILQRGVLSILRRARRAKDVALVYASRSYANLAYWRLNERFERLYRLARQEKVDIWLANDWTALPIVRRLAAEQSTLYAYDTHELAVDEYAQHWLWRMMQRPLIAAIESGGIAGAAVTSCVSQGIADRLSGLYGLPKKPLLIRNMPRYEAHPFRPCGDRIAVIYHGVVNVGRGLEACIDSVASWHPDFHLTIRGPGPARYLEGLAVRIRTAGVADRVALAPPVPMTELVQEAARFDIGLFALPGHSQQNVHVLPNKFFEYAMAGLALCVSDLPEMTALLRQHGLGRSISEVTPQAIAAAINSFTRAEIDACKQRSLVAAKQLNWEAESDQLFLAIERAVLSASGAERDAVRID